MGRWWKITLIASLAVNLLIAGAVVGAVVSGQPSSERRGGGAEQGRFAAPPEIGMMARSLDRTQRGALRRGLWADGGLRDGVQQVRASRETILAALRAEPFEIEAVQAALEDQRAIQSELAARGLQVVSDLIADMSSVERAAYADRIEASMRRGPRSRPR